MNIRHNYRGFVRVLGIVILASLVLSFSAWFSHSHLSKQSGNNLANVYYGGYGGPIGPIKGTPIPIKDKEGDPDIRCWIRASDVNRVDPVRHPRLYKMQKDGSGYCGIYGYLLSLYHTFGIREISTGKTTTMPITDPKNKENMNLDLIEWQLKNTPGLMNGATNTEIIALYKSVGKECVVVKTKELQLKKQCQDISKYKEDGYDCDMGLYREDSAHTVNIKSVSWSNWKNSCVHKVYDTSNQADPKIKPKIHTVTTSFWREGFHPLVDYPESKDEYDVGTDYICCK